MDATHLVETAAGLLGRPLHLVSELQGGQHARTLLVTDQASQFVVRGFPPGDDAVDREVAVLPRLRPLGETAPRLVAQVNSPEGPVIVTTRVPGGHPPTEMAPSTMAAEMGRMLAAIHALSANGLPSALKNPPGGADTLSRLVRQTWSTMSKQPQVLTHRDYWCGNALWTDHRLSGVVDWSGALAAPRGVDIAWCRQDLVLLGSPEAAELLLAAYQDASGITIEDIDAWDLHAAALADPYVETWAPNYAGIGRDIMPAELRRRLDEWSETLLRSA